MELEGCPSNDPFAPYVAWKNLVIFYNHSSNCKQGGDEEASSLANFSQQWKKYLVVTASFRTLFNVKEGRGTRE